MNFISVFNLVMTINQLILDLYALLDMRLALTQCVVLSGLGVGLWSMGKYWIYCITFVLNGLYSSLNIIQHFT